MGWEEITHTPDGGIKNLVYVTPEFEEYRKREDEHFKSLGLIRDLDYAWEGDDLVIYSKKAREHFTKCFEETKKLLGLKKLPYRKYRNHKVTNL